MQTMRHWLPLLLSAAAFLAAGDAGPGFPPVPAHRAVQDEISVLWRVLATLPSPPTPETAAAEAAACVMIQERACRLDIMAEQLRAGAARPTGEALAELRLRAGGQRALHAAILARLGDLESRATRWFPADRARRYLRTMAEHGNLYGHSFTVRPGMSVDEVRAVMGPENRAETGPDGSIIALHLQMGSQRDDGLFETLVISFRDGRMVQEEPAFMGLGAGSGR